MESLLQEADQMGIMDNLAKEGDVYSTALKKIEKSLS